MTAVTRLAPFLFAAALAWCAAAAAQSESPLLDTPAEQRAPEAEEQPAVDTAPVVKMPRVGTDIVGERESPIGLFITPWKDSGAEQALERSARLLQEELLPIDEDVFIRTLEYYEALSGALKSKKAVTPPVPPGSLSAPSDGPAATPPSITP